MKWLIDCLAIFSIDAEVLSQNENPLLFQILLTLKKYFGIAKYEGITQFNQQFYLLLKKVNYLS